MEPKADSEGAVYHWSPEKYIELVEHTSNPLLREYQQVELEYVTSKIQSPGTKTFIDVGAGYGRVLPQIARIAGGGCCS
jgi:tRNA G46 methylase TrmB